MPAAADEWLAGIRDTILAPGTTPDAHPVAAESPAFDLPIRFALYGRAIRWRIHDAVFDRMVQDHHVRNGPRAIGSFDPLEYPPRANERIGGIGKARADGELRGLIPVCLEAGKTSVCVATAIPKPTQTLALCRRRQPVTGVDQSPSLSKVGLMTLRPEIGSAICAPRRFWRAEPAARSTPSRSARLSPLKEARPSASAGH